MHVTHQPVKLITKINFRYFSVLFIDFCWKRESLIIIFIITEEYKWSVLKWLTSAFYQKEKKKKPTSFYSQFCHLLERWKSLWKGDKAQVKSWQETVQGRRGMWQDCEIHNVRRLYLFLDGPRWSSVKAVHFHEQRTTPFIQKGQQSPYREMALIMSILETRKKRLRTRPNVQSVFLQTSKLQISL